MPSIDVPRFIALTLALAGASLAGCASATRAPAPPPVVAVAEPAPAPDPPALADTPETGGTAATGQDSDSQPDPSAELGAADDPSGEDAGIVGLLGPNGEGIGTLGPIGHGAGSAHLGGAAPATTGTLTTEEIRKAMRAGTPGLKRCYDAELAKDPAFEARVVVRFVISPTGRIGSATLTSPSGRTAMDSCLLSTLRKLVFPKPHGGAVTVSYPLIFKSA